MESSPMKALLETLHVGRTSHQEPRIIFVLIGRKSTLRSEGHALNNLPKASDSGYRQMFSKSAAAQAFSSETATAEESWLLPGVPRVECGW